MCTSCDGNNGVPHGRTWWNWPKSEKNTARLPSLVSLPDVKYRGKADCGGVRCREGLEWPLLQIIIWEIRWLFDCRFSHVIVQWSLCVSVVAFAHVFRPVWFPTRDPGGADVFRRAPTSARQTRVAMFDWLFASFFLSRNICFDFIPA